MSRVGLRKAKPPGMPPGTLVHVGEKKMENIRISLLDYDEGNFQERAVEKVEDCFPFKETPTVTWINIDGLHDVEVIQKLGHHFDLHPLLLEDILSTHQRPKLEDFDQYLFVVLKMLTSGDEGKEIDHEQVSIILGSNYVISFQEREGDVFDPVRDRLRKSKGRIRKMGADYLAYALLDAIVDNYFVILERFGERLEEIEEELLSDPRIETLHTIHALKQQAIILRRSIWPLREVIGALERGESSLIQESSRIYFRDVYDHTIQVIDSVETFRDTISSMIDLYMSSLSNKMNEVMKVLTIIATIFIPITFVAGIYGMNFENMPELGWKYGYFMVWSIIIGIGSVMVLYFRKQKWL